MSSMSGLVVLGVGDCGFSVGVGCLDMPWETESNEVSATSVTYEQGFCELMSTDVTSETVSVASHLG